MRFLALAILLSFCVGCHRSGTWEDSPKNWERAFGQKPPAGITILHSSYWRSPHFTLEFEYFFQVEPSESVRKELRASHELRLFTPGTREEKAAVQSFFQRKPEWFIPKPLDRYEIWTVNPSDTGSGHFRLFIDRQTGVMFMTDYLV